MPTPAARNPIAGNQTPLQPVNFNPQFRSQIPRFIVKIDGKSYLGTRFSYTQNAHGATDTARITLPIDGSANYAGIAANSLYPDWTESIKRSDKLSNANAPVVCEIWSGAPPDPSVFGPQTLTGLILRFRGIVDQYSSVLEENETTFDCRSLAFPLTSTKITVPFPKEDTTTTVAFIQQQAARFGLTLAPPNLGQAPALMIDVFGGEFITGVRGWYIWDIFIQCAQHDDVDIWVDRTGAIHYEAASLVKRKSIAYRWGENIKGLASTHSPQFSKNVQVQVHSWTVRTRTASATRVQTNAAGGYDVSSYTRQVTSTPISGTTDSVVTSISSNGTVTTTDGSSSGGSVSDGTGTESETGREKYTFFVKNKTLPQCEAMAQQIWRQISMHEYAIKLRVPVTTANLPLMDVTAQPVIYGHPMALFNGKYWPREIVESLDPKTGWYWEIDAVNHALPQSAV